MDTTVLMINILNGLIWGSILGASAIGLTLLWGVMKVVNIAEGETLLLGSYIIIWAYMSYGITPYIGMWMALIVGAIVGLVVYWALLHKLVGKVEIITLKTEMSTLLVMFALSTFLYNAYYYWIGSEPRGIGLWHVGGEVSYVTVGGITLRVNSIFAAILAILTAVATHLFLTRTMAGKSIRAVMQDAQAASLAGIDPVKVKMLTAILGIGITAFTGFLVLLHEAAITPEMSHKYAPVAFTIVVLGGLGSVMGSLIGGFIIGLVYGVSKVMVAEYYTPLAADPIALSTAFIIMVLVLLFRPQGLFGRR